MTKGGPETIDKPGKCKQCGTDIQPNAPFGYCADCLVMLGFGPLPTVLKEQTPPGLGEQPSSPTKVRYFGDYELIEEIARGGMGVVFKARQVSLNRLVAVKLISSGALATEDLVKRFKAEAEAAASLSHPNIVPIYEIGEHEGQHYFSMGLIDGPDLRETLAQIRTSNCETRKASEPSHVGFNEPRQAARLVAIVARAVHYAHQRGVLHRDIKPSNILLDSAGEPHLTDFGLAKLLQQETTLTRTNAVMGTPAYMAPEQARGETKDVTTAADVYGLGAVLYETLTGSPPFAGGTSMETIRQVLEQEPRSPSLWNAEVDRDLETICLKCLEKDPSRRYGSAEVLAEDLDRWWRVEPILARPITHGERTWRWCRRNPKLAVSSGTAVLVFVSGFAGVLWQWHRAESLAGAEIRQRQRAERHAKVAERESTKSRQVAQFLKDTLSGVGPSVALGRDTTMLREILDKAADRVSKELRNEPDAAAELLSIIGRTYEQVGEYAKAEVMHRMALEMNNRLVDADGLRKAESFHDLGWALHRLGRLDEASQLLRQSLTLKRTLLGNEHQDVAMNMASLAQSLQQQGQFAEAERLFQESLALKRHLFGNSHPAVADGLRDFGVALRAQGKLADAEPLLRESLTLSRRLWSGSHPSLANSLHSLGVLLRLQKKLPEAEALLREALSMNIKLLGEAHPNVALYKKNLGVTLAERGEIAQGCALLAEALKLQRRVLGPDHRDVALTLHEFGCVLRNEGTLDQAETVLREALSIRTRLFGATHPDVSETAKVLASVLEKAGKVSEAQQLEKETAPVANGRGAGSR
jgi:serine/threonine protein kinase/tetratricopeptide (TPR) repeat protein